ncbi:TNF receptor-associated factor 6-like [Anneissia japonica]|uniref:TNF receptor-associated factor 6-like n=1 Tax=Anneissia japonica TaxID=1529436 RepID=UPI001425A4E9|nr:TNF receptor-associated factor 6-like [Anneissia japonica]
MSQRTDKEKLLGDPLRVSAHRPQRPPSGPGPPHMASIGSHLADDNVEGYDLTFVPSLDQKYECPICLMCLREPVQTECGHRFCCSCIKKSLRDTGERCPVDNTSLTESQMFLDVCVKREIMDLQARCPHSGCQQVLELRHIEVHQANCEFLPIPCPNRCGTFCLLAGIEEHLAKACPKRRLACEFCEAMVQLNRMESHLDVCPKVKVECQYCGEQLVQEQVKSHIDMYCPKVEAPCVFTLMGCKEKMVREKLQEHLNQSLHKHMSMLANNLMQLQFSTAHTITHQYRSLADDHPQDQLTSGISSITSSMDSMQMKQPDYRHQSRGGYTTSWQQARGGMNEHTRQQSREGRDSPRPQDLETEVLILKDRLKYQEQKTAVQEQKIFELHSKVLLGDQKLAEKNEIIDILKDQLRNIEARNCGGKFYWKLEHFHSLCEEANLKGSDSVVRHSVGFYTSFYGYKLCVRVNLNCKDPNQGYVSLFIHFMKGDFDDYLEWPFQGNITLSIEDQNIDFVKRKHISETLIAKPGLAAFDKPASNRNHKGFGYMEFAPLASLEKGSYIKDGAVLVKVVVCPTSSK